jgi:hypothetical protein
MLVAPILWVETHRKNGMSVIIFNRQGAAIFAAPITGHKK